MGFTSASEFEVLPIKLEIVQSFFIVGFVATLLDMYLYTRYWSYICK